MSVSRRSLFALCAAAVFARLAPAKADKWKPMLREAKNPGPPPPRPTPPKAPPRTTRCPFVFGDPPCGYPGGGFTTCDKTIADCKARGNFERFGGFPGV